MKENVHVDYPKHTQTFDMVKLPRDFGDLTMFVSKDLEVMLRSEIKVEDIELGSPHGGP